MKDRQAGLVSQMEVVNYQDNWMLIGHRREKLLKRLGQLESGRFAACVEREWQIGRPSCLTPGIARASSDRLSPDVAESRRTRRAVGESARRGSRKVCSAPDHKIVLGRSTLPRDSLQRSGAPPRWSCLHPSHHVGLNGFADRSSSLPEAVEFPILLGAALEWAVATRLWG